ncbi:MAG: HEAT repeat domain-containing protein [Candidatus Micrarchaeota archaeon]
MQVQYHISSFESEDALVRKEAILAVASAGKEAVQPLLQALKHPVPYVRASAAKALGKIGAPEAIGALSDALMHDEVVVKCPAAIALGKTKDHKAVPALTEALKDESRFVRSYSYTNLCGLIKSCKATMHLESIKVHLRHVLETAHGKNREETQMAAATLLKKADARIYSLMASENDGCLKGPTRKERPARGRAATLTR